MTDPSPTIVDFSANPPAQGKTPPSFRSHWASFLAFRIVRIGIIVYLALGIMFAGLQRNLIYHPNSEPVVASMAGAMEPRLTEVNIATEDDLTLQGWHIHAFDTSDEFRPLVVYFPGNSANRGRRVMQISMFNRLGCDVLIVDYRGYGGNPGSPSEEGLARDANAIWKYATTDLAIPPERIVLFGESLGGGVAIRLASELCEGGTRPRGLIIQASFSSMVDAGRYHFRWLPVNWVLLDRYPSDQRMPLVTCPVILYHGEQDEIVPFALGQKLFDTVPAVSANGIPKRFVPLANAGHNDILHVVPDQVENILRDFLAEIAVASPESK